MSALDRERLHRALNGDTVALRAVIELMTPVVRARVTRALGRRLGFGHPSLMSDVADFTQEVFVAFFHADAKALRAWDPDRGMSFLNFVGLLAQNRVAEILRTRRWQSQTEELPLSDSHLRETSREPDVDSEDRLKRLLEHLEATLSVRALDMFERLYVHAQTPEQIGRETGLTLDAVYQWRSRLAKAARDAMREIEAEQKPPATGQRAATAQAGRRTR